jgi:hypothetical protein
MNTIAISLSDEQFVQLGRKAAEAGLSPEEFLRRRVEQMLYRLDEELRQAAIYVLAKNAELYRRLA